VLDANGRKVHGETFACTAVELERFAKAHLGSQAACVLEATSNTWAVCGILSSHCGILKVSNPLKTKAIAQASVKTDKVDAQVLAQLLRCDYLPGVWMADESTRRLRQQVARRTALVQDRTAVKNRIHSHLAGELVTAPVDKLFEKTGMTWLKQVPLNPQVREYIDSDLRILQTLEREIEKLDKQITAAAWKCDQAKLLMTLPGVDYPVAMTLLAAFGDIARFKDGDHAASYLGLTPSTRQSAEHCYHGPITKHGNSHARWMLIEAAQHLDKHPGPLGVFFRRLAKKKNRNVAVVATARKLVTIAYLMLKTHEPYRYAQPATVQAKLARLRIRGGGKRRKTGTKKGSGQHPNYGTGNRSKRIPPLQEVYRREGMAEPKPLEQLPPSEQRMLADAGLLPVIAGQRQETFRAKALGGGPSGPKPRPQTPTGSPSSPVEALTEVVT
jgi:transposase